MVILRKALIYSVYFSMTVLAFHKENDFREKILERYNKSIAPIGMTEATKAVISVGIILRRIHKFSAEDSTLSCDGYFYRGWYDERLVWKSQPEAGYFGIDQNLIWTPTIITFNKVKKEETSAAEPVFVTGTGDVYNTEMTRLHTYCKPSLKYFPFDTHKCDLIHGTWISKGESIETHSSSDFGDYLWDRYLLKNTKWEITSFSSKRQNYYPIPSNKEVFIPAKITTIVIKRTAPLIALSILTVGVTSILLGFLPMLLSPDSDLCIRLSLGTIGLLIVGQTDDVINQFASIHQGEQPLISQYVTACTAFLTLSLMETLIVNFLVRSTSKPSNRMASIVTWSLSKRVFSFLGVRDGVSSDGHRLIEENIENPSDIEEPQPLSTVDVKWDDVAVFIDSTSFCVLSILWIVFSVTVFLTD